MDNTATIEISIKEYKNLIQKEILLEVLRDFIKGKSYISYEDLAGVFGWKIEEKEDK